MIEGWHNDDYLILFNDLEEAQHMTHAYGIGQYLPGFTMIGLRGWDDFILSDAQGDFFILPTVPLDSKKLESLNFNVNPSAITTDERFTNKVKWYVKPLLFGGDPSDPEDLIWVTIEQHAELVRWWAKLYRDMTA